MTKEILIAARALIAKPENWTQKYLARNSKGDAVHYGSTEAACFCGIGAIYKCAKDAGAHRYETVAAKEKFNEYISNSTDFISMARLNDQSSHKEVLAMFDKYIETLP